MLKEFSTPTNVVICDFQFNTYLDNLRKHGHKSLPEAFIKEIDKHDIIILADILCRSFVVEVSRRLRENLE